jgi:8-oxo-dGTP pyrophosphatase MutT (NUDIX family)
MHRNDILQALTQYKTRYTEEAAIVDRLVGFVQTYPDCFERSLSVGHITGSAWLVNEPGTHVLLTHHHKLNAWLQLGGHADGDANVSHVALREDQEESGLTQIEPVGGTIFVVDIHAIPARPTEPAHFHYDVRYAFRAIGSEPSTVRDESHALAWIDIAELPQHVPDDSICRMARKWLRQHASDGITAPPL